MQEMNSNHFNLKSFQTSGFKQRVNLLHIEGNFFLFSFSLFFFYIPKISLMYSSLCIFIPLHLITASPQQTSDSFLLFCLTQSLSIRQCMQVMNRGKGKGDINLTQELK